MKKKVSNFIVMLVSCMAALFTSNYIAERIRPSNKDKAVVVKNTNDTVTDGEVSLTEFETISLYHDNKQKDFASYAIPYEEFILTIGDDPLPTQLYLKDGKMVEVLGSSASGKPTLYTKAGKSFEKPNIPSFNTNNVKEMQLISGFQNFSNLETTTGEYENQRLHFPSKLINASAIALINDSEKWIPVGYWNFEKKSFCLFNDDDQLKSFFIFSATDPFISETDDTYYILENEYQQIVFSEADGSIVEINLKLQSEENKSIVIKPTDIDKKITDLSVENFMFPNKDYYIVDTDGVRRHKDPQYGGHTPLLRRNLKNSDGTNLFTMPGRYHAFNLVDEKRENSPLKFKIDEFSSSKIKFLAITPNRKIYKTFSLIEGSPYSLSAEIKVDGDTKGLWLTSGVPEVELISGSYSPNIQYLTSPEKTTKTKKVKLPKRDNSFYSEASPTWTSNSNGFFGIIVNPLSDDKPSFKVNQIAPSQVTTRLSLLDNGNSSYSREKFPGYEVLIPYQSTKDVLSYRIYAGPYDETVLKNVDLTFTNDALPPQFSNVLTFQGWLPFITEPFAKLLMLTLNFLHSLTNSWGIAIILLTLVFKMLLYPLNSWAYKSNMKMQRLAPKQKELQEKYKDDPKRLQMEMAMLYKTERVNPFSGCLPILIQIPFLMGMLEILKSTFALRGASFIPGWINDLTSPDTLFTWSQPIFFFGTSFHLLPFLVGGLMFIQQRLNATSQAKKDCSQSDQQKQINNMGNIMTVVFTFIFYNMPSGLNIYFAFSTIFGILQQLFVTNKFGKSKKTSTKLLKNR